MFSPRSIGSHSGHMWRLIKTDIAYNQAVFIALIGVVLAATVLNAIFGELEEHVSRLILVSVGVLGVISGSEEIKTKRIRLTIQLPIPIRLNGILRFPVIAMCWLSCMVILWSSSLISRQGNLSLDYLWFILAKTALIMAMVSCMNIAQDVPSCFIQKVPGDILKVLAKLCAIGAAFLYFLSTPFEDWPPVVIDTLASIFITPVGALGLLIISSGLMVLSIFVYEHRRSYTE
jgi:hypothetical protein